jgi:hypothetical protein
MWYAPLRLIHLQYNCIFSENKYIFQEILQKYPEKSVEFEFYAFILPPKEQNNTIFQGDVL